MDLIPVDRVAVTDKVLIEEADQILEDAAIVFPAFLELTLKAQERNDISYTYLTELIFEASRILDCTVEFAARRLYQWSAIGALDPSMELTSPRYAFYTTYRQYLRDISPLVMELLEKYLPEGATY